MMRRIERIVTKENTRNKRFHQMENWLLALNYPAKLIHDAIKKLKDIDIWPLKQEDDKNTINFISTFNSNNPKVYPIIKYILELIKLDEETKEIKKNKKKRNPNRQSKKLKTLLTTAKLKQNKKEYSRKMSVQIFELKKRHLRFSLYNNRA